ncbi:MAG: hypothetical protein NC349_08930 [Paenibacillus sp.]|nr:hypothetical protein [Paenibacillus sp.]
MDSSNKKDLSDAKRLDDAQAKGVVADPSTSTDDLNFLPASIDKPKLDACIGKKFHDPCFWTHNYITYYGRCVYNQLAFEKELYCSDIFRDEE